MTSVLVAFLRHPLALLSAVLLLVAPVSTALASRLDEDGRTHAQLAFDLDIQAGWSFDAAAGAEWRSSDFEPETVAYQELPGQLAVLAWMGWSAGTTPGFLPQGNPGAELSWTASLRWCDRSARGPPTI